MTGFSNKENLKSTYSHLVLQETLAGQLMEKNENGKKVKHVLK